MTNKILEKLGQFPLTEKLAVLILLFALIIQFGTVLYFRFSPLMTEYDALKKFEMAVGEVTDKAATYIKPTTSEIPVKARIPHGNPRYYQMERGTCWDFALIGTIEDDYRQHGISEGFLDADEYVRFSTQVLGIRMVEHCNEHPDVCNTPGDMLL